MDIDTVLERLQDLEARLRDRGANPFLSADANGEEFLQFSVIVHLLVRDMLHTWKP